MTNNLIYKHFIVLKVTSHHDLYQIRVRHCIQLNEILIDHFIKYDIMRHI